MLKATFAIACLALLLALVALQRPTLLEAYADQPPPKDDWKAVRNYPPLVFNSTATLDCKISATGLGRQIMKTVSGQGFDFDAIMLPIKEGWVKLKKPGMNYQFTSYPSNAIPATLKGIGEGMITEFQAEVEVDVRRYDQPGGPGTEISFNSSDIVNDAAYVEFTGVFVRQKDKKEFPFRVLFGSVPDGQGRVTPADSKPNSRMMAKAVAIGTLTRPATVVTALYEREDDVAVLKP